MKAVFSTSGEILDAPLDPRFGRAPRLLVVDTETEAASVVDNTHNLQAVQGAGIQSAQAVARAEAECLVTGHCGPKAFRVLQAAGIRVYTSEAPTVRAALGQLLAGELTELSAPDVAGHWS